MNTEALNKEIMAAKYKEFEKLIYYTCHRFAYKYGGDVTEYISNANTIFIRAYKEWNPETSRVSEATHYRSWVHMSLLDIYRPIWTRNKRYGSDVEQEFLEAIPERKKEDFLDMEVMRHNLTKDGLTLLQLILHAPTELQKIIDGKGGTPRNYRSSVKDYLRKAYGWDANRVKAAFADLGHELFGRPDKQTSPAALQAGQQLMRQVARQGAF